MKLYMKTLLIFIITMSISSLSVNAATISGKGGNTIQSIIAQKFPTPKQQKQRFTCTLNAPNEIHRYGVSCSGASFIDVAVTDCCMSGDSWEAKAKVWDSKPNTAVTTSPDTAGVVSVNARVFNYGGTAANPGGLDAELDCSYNHGVNVFPAAATYQVVSDGFCTVTDLGSSHEIRRAP